VKDIKETFISIVSPVYKAEKIIPELVRRISESVSSITPDFEIILVNDSSPDDSWAAIKKEIVKGSKVKGINLSRNFGQHASIHAGLKHVTGNWVVVMDCDLQDQPEEIPKLLNKAHEGFDAVFAKRKERNDSLLKKQLSKLFYTTLGFLTDTKQDPEIANFGVYSRKIINAILLINDYTKYFPTMVKWVGFKTTSISVDHANRFDGCSSYNFKSLLKLGINVILSFSDKPLRLTVKMGLLISLTSFLFAVYTFFNYLTGGIEVLGYASLIISIWLLSGIIITLIGMTGLYIGKIFDQVKQRPVYIIDEVV
jgi:polyisoprenyl-phosphate glycosyltransferase